MPDFMPAYTHSLLPVEVDNLSITTSQALAVAIAAQGTLTMDTQPTDGDTYTIDTKTYTFQTTLTDVDGNVNIGGSLAQAKLNLVAAIDLSGVAGTDYATSMTAHPSVDVAAFVGDDAVITAQTAGVAGNSIATTETFAAGTNVFDAATLGTTRAGNDAGQTLYQAGVLVAEDVAIRVNFGAAATATVGRLVPISGTLQMNDKEIALAQIASTAGAAAVSIVYYR
jgi:hypothetical protein